MFFENLSLFYIELRLLRMTETIQSMLIQVVNKLKSEKE